MMFELVSIGTCEVVTVLEQWRAYSAQTPLGPRHTATVNEWKKLGKASPGFFVGRSELAAIRPTLRMRGSNKRAAGGEPRGASRNLAISYIHAVKAGEVACKREHYDLPHPFLDAMCGTCRPCRRGRYRYH